MQLDLFTTQAARPALESPAKGFPFNLSRAPAPKPAPVPAATPAPAPAVTTRRPVFSAFSDITCGEACWHAREDVCRCSCGGKNHGCLKTGAGEERPARTAKIDGHRYELAAVGGNEVYAAARQLNMAAGWRSIDRSMPAHPYHYDYSETDDGAPGRVKPASREQLTRWPELANRPAGEYTLLFWRKIEQPAPNFCAVPCARCDRQRERAAGR